MVNEQNILLAFYGDDLTGSTDALEFICRAGANAVLFMNPPTPEQLCHYRALQAYGIAGLTRALSPEEMEKKLVPAFEAMKESGAKHVHYKVCSTFDSTPQIGSIGKAIDIGSSIFTNKVVPVLGGMPLLDRYCVFGNLFARMGIGSKGRVYRLDRHPSMSIHPITPSTESDLRMHLGNQTKKKIGLIDITKIDNDLDAWNDAIQAGEDIVLLDAAEDEHLLRIGDWLNAQAKTGESLFSVGSSGIEYALGSSWNKTNVLKAPKSWLQVEAKDAVLVLSGSCSPVTKKQIAYAQDHGFVAVPLEQNKVDESNSDAFGCDLEKVVSLLQNGQSVIVHTGELNGVEQSTSAETLGTALGTIGERICGKVSLQRIVVAGGDTSSYVARALGIESLEIIAPFLPGAPMCKAHAPQSPIDGLQVNFKGGQVGAEDYFVQMKEGVQKRKEAAQ